DQANFIKGGVETFQAAHENDKRLDLQQGITKELEKALGKPLDATQREEVSMLVGDVVRADKNGLGMDKLLDSLTNATGLKSYQVGPVVDMISKYHEKSSEKAAFVGEGVDKFRKVQEKDNSEYLNKISDLTLKFNDSLEKELGKPMTEAQKDASAKLVMNYTEANKGQVGPAMEELIRATGLTPGKVMNTVAKDLYSFHKDNNQSKHDLVMDELAPIYEAAEKLQPLVEKAGRALDDTIEKALGRPMNPKEREAADKFFGDLVSVSPENVGNLDKSFEALQKATGMDKSALAQLATDVTNTVYPGDKGKKDLVNDGISKQLQTSEVEVELAQDSFILPSASGRGQTLATGGQNKDEIIEAIRKEVIEKQNAFLVDKIAAGLPPDQQQAFKGGLNTPDKAREYLESDQGKGQVEALMKNKQVQLELAKIESTGYSKVHEQFKESYRDVSWKQDQGSKTRVSEVTNANGEKIASIKETTLDTAPTKVKLSDGTEKTIRSHREIDFPKNLDSGKGPAHFSMALKDENGRNMSEKDAVYFTAHYDDNGKLMEVSSPKPVKFTDTGVGYIERNGQVFTLPVNKDKYEEMMQEVAINNGRSSTVDRSVEQAVDSVAVGSKEQPSRARENQVDEPTVTGRPRGKQVLESDRPVINPLSGQVVDPQVAKKATKLKEGLENPTPRTPAPKEQHGRPRSQSMPPPKPIGMTM
ncbi:MAG: hypothetical protein J0L79_05345, partial [Rickettsiales bacterium]|nr:hypothetical protein [Rickettsiales bacterium]